MIRGAKGEIIEEPDDLDKEIALLEQKLKTVAQPIEISKSQKAILELYDNSISELIKKFIDKGEKFEKFYVKNLFYLNGVYVTSPHSKYDAILNYRNSIKEDISSIVFQFDYQAFNQTGFQEFNHISQIRFTFDTTRYRVGNSSGVTIEKLYGEQLDEMEINEIINAEIRRHKQFIESEIEMIKKKKL